MVKTRGQSQSPKSSPGPNLMTGNQQSPQMTKEPMQGQNIHANTTPPHNVKDESQEKNMDRYGQEGTDEVDHVPTGGTSPKSLSVNQSYRANALPNSSQPLYPKLDLDDLGRRGIHEGMADLVREEKAIQMQRPPKASKQTDKTSSNKNNDEDVITQFMKLIQTNSQFCQTCMLLMVVFLCFAFYLYVNAPNDNPKQPVITANSRLMMVKDFDEQFQTVIEKFPNQDKRFWKIVKAACKGVLRDPNPFQPAVIMLAAHRDHSKTTECIASHITRSFSAVYGDAADTFPMSARDYKRFPSPNELKMHIDTSLHAAFSQGSRAAQISEIHRIPGKAAAMFHAFCDNENAPYKDAAILFTVHTESHADRDSAVEDYLTELWGNDLDIDSLTPLLSRMANSIALVKGEEESVIRQHCPAM